MGEEVEGKEVEVREGEGKEGRRKRVRTPPVRVSDYASVLSSVTKRFWKQPSNHHLAHLGARSD